MKKQIFIALILAAAVCAIIRAKTDKNHVCHWQECPINDNGLKVQKDPASDTECFVHCHYTNPLWTPNQIEKYIFSYPQ